MAPLPIIIDTDPGQDDAIAILLALASPEFDVRALTAVAGNVGLERTERNARQICELAGRNDVPVFAGCPRPLLRAPVSAEHVHGETGLNGAGLPDPSMPLAPQHAVGWLIDTLRTAREPLTVCTLGPLTNIAAALIQAPEITRGIKTIVAMAGAVHTHGNITPAAEFNVYADPHAARVVFEAGCDLVLMPLDVTHQALTTPERLARFKALPGEIGKACYGMLGYYYRPNRDRFGIDGSPLHDPCVIAYLLEPEIFSGKQVHVAIETDSPLTMGMTLADWWGSTGKTPNCFVADKIDDERFFNLIFERLGQLRTT